MKFSKNTRVVAPNTIGNVRRSVPASAPAEAIAYGQGGKGWDGLTNALGVGLKVVQKQQDDRDAADVMEARNAIMSSLTKDFYGENGMITNGVGENAKGLTDRVTKTVQDTFDKVSRNYNKRVQRALQGNLSENMGNFQRLAAQQEGREFTSLKENNFNSALSLDGDLMAENYADALAVENGLNDSMRLLNYRAADIGLSNSQLMASRRALITKQIGGVIGRAIADEDYTQASIYLEKYGSQMNQSDVAKLSGQLRKQKDVTENNYLGKQIFAKFGNDRAAAEKYIYETLANENITLSQGGGSGGSFSGMSDIDGYLNEAAAEFGVSPSLLAAVANVETGGRFDNSMESPVGAKGIMQLMPSTAAELGVNPADVRDNIRGGAKYLRQMLDRFGGDEEKALAAYNAGAGTVEQYGGIPLYGETQDYVAKVKSARNGYEKQAGGWDISAGEKFLGQTMANGQSGCVEFVTKLGEAGGNGFLAAEKEKGVVRVPTLIKDAGDKFQPFNANNLQAGDVIVYDGDSHVVVYDGQGGYYGNSSGQNKVVHGSDYTQMEGMQPTGIIKTGGGASALKTYTRAKYSANRLDDIMRLYDAELASNHKTEELAKKQKIESYGAQMQGADAVTIQNILNQVKANESYDVYSNVASMARTYAPELFRASTGGGSRSGRNSGGDSSGGGTSSRKVSSSVGTLAVQLGTRGSVSSGTLAAVRADNRNNLSEEEWQYIQSKDVQGQLADLAYETGGNLKAVYKALESKMGAEMAARVVATMDDDYFSTDNSED